LLSVILSYAKFAFDGLDPSDPVRDDLEEIRFATERAASLTRQLLAHSRKQVFQVSVLGLGDVVRGVEPMLRRLLGEDLDLQLDLATDLWPLRADKGQLEQVIVNLAVNARDAMPQGGRVTVRTRNLLTGAHGGPGLWEGPAVLLEITDTGVGMDEATKARVFEPFFTTKQLGKGTGLGLATVYGIVKQSGGDIRVESAPGAGSTFRIALPRHEASGEEAAARPEPAALEPQRAPASHETILLVEDEDAVRTAAQRILHRAGYRVLTAASGSEALERFAEYGNEVRLLLTDVVMPQMSGHALATRLTGLRPGLKVVYMSGYLDEVLGQHGVLPEEIRFIGKPFQSSELTQLVRETLDGVPRAQA
jgi:CheY-like chemotaxis protein